MQSVQVALPICNDSVLEGREDFIIRPDNYVLHRVSSVSGDRYYQSEGPPPVDAMGFNISIEDGLPPEIAKNGGRGSFSFDAPFEAGMVISGTFTPFENPDRLIVRDASGTLVDTGFVSGNLLPINFAVPKASTGEVKITIEAPNEGTGWEFQLHSVGFIPESVKEAGQRFDKTGVDGSLLTKDTMQDANCIRYSQRGGRFYHGVSGGGDFGRNIARAMADHHKHSVDIERRRCAGHARRRILGRAGRLCR